MSALAEASENDDRLTDEEILSTAILLFSAGFETTTNLLGNGLLALLAHPDQAADWKAHPEIAPSAVEELLRFDSPVQFNMRTALEPADLIGEPLARGDRIIVLQGAANRDPEAFDRPEALDLRRAPQHAVELRLGDPSLHRRARWRGMEGEIAFNALVGTRSSHRAPRTTSRNGAPVSRCAGFSRSPCASALTERPTRRPAGARRLSWAARSSTPRGPDAST